MSYGKVKNRSVMSHDFSRVPSVDIQRSTFKRNHSYKTMFDSGYLIPIYCDEVLPGDTFNLRLSSICRMVTPLVPIMDNLFIDFQFFYVPNRLLWDNWQKFMGERTNPGDSIDYTVPYLTTTNGDNYEGELLDYMGIPPGIHGDGVNVNSLHMRAYYLIWNEWYRDQNLQNSLTVPTDDGPDAATDFVLQKRNKRHDYFTSALPWPQKGTAVDLPLGTSAPVSGTISPDGTNAPSFTDGTSTFNLRFVNGSANTNWSGTAGQDYSPYWSDPNLTLTGATCDLSSATAATINSLREAFQLQRMMEKDARSGTRYVEILKSHFKVESPDARLQRPEYLGGGSYPINVTPVAQTSESNTTEQGKLTAVAFHSQSGCGFSKSFVEHGVLIGLASVRCDLTYQQGVRRMWSRQTRYDYYWPSLANLGEQEVLQQEIYSATASENSDVFGYQERWAEYRYFPSLITSTLRSTHSASLDVWHLSQEFGSKPQLNSAFIEENPPISRVVAVTSEPEFVFDGYFDLTCARPMPMYSVPGYIDHF